MGDISPHFSHSEFRSHDGSTQYIPPSWPLIVVLEEIRAFIKGPLTIRSGYRSPDYNRQVGGAVRSRHLSGDAADIPAGVITPAQARSFGATGIGIDGSGLWAIHVDTRPLGRAGWPSKEAITWRYVLGTGLAGLEDGC